MYQNKKIKENIFSLSVCMSLRLHACVYVCCVVVYKCLKMPMHVCLYAYVEVRDRDLIFSSVAICLSFEIWDITKPEVH